ncbi:4-hydroxybenzoate octaprenyltransferase [Pelagibacteraceae bacterium]|nr:4-hydroxybenzoate octaprenyltransferase [Pelagibacteraceae bacterium]
MKDLKIFINLTRLNRPIGYLLLFWPCSWGLAYAYSFNKNIEIFLSNLILFFFGAVLMRSAGCIVNDMVDRKVDKKVKRTRNRPLAANLISLKKAFLYVVILCSLAFTILIQFNYLTIVLGLASMSLAFSYPFMKRITYWPQLFLGLTFNWGIIMAWASISNNLNIDIFTIYFAAIFWTLGYDTIYGAQDIVDDEIIGVKSTSIKFKSMLKKFVLLCYLISLLTIIVFFLNNMNSIYFLIPFSAFTMTLFYQLYIFDKRKPKTCLQAFKTNNFSGFYLFLTFLTISF